MFPFLKEGETEAREGFLDLQDTAGRFIPRSSEGLFAFKTTAYGSEYPEKVLP
jgi:hypothetical protein